jgi:hypothetical protein
MPLFQLSSDSLKSIPETEFKNERELQHPVVNDIAHAPNHRGQAQPPTWVASLKVYPTSINSQFS